MSSNSKRSSTGAAAEYDKLSNAVGVLNKQKARLQEMEKALHQQREEHDKTAQRSAELLQKEREEWQVSLVQKCLPTHARTQALRLFSFAGGPRRRGGGAAGQARQGGQGGGGAERQEGPRAPRRSQEPEHEAAWCACGADGVDAV